MMCVYLILLPVQPRVPCRRSNRIPSLSQMALPNEQDEHESTDEGFVKVKKGRLDVHKDKGLNSVEDLRAAARSDLAKYNAKRRAKNKRELSEQEFEAKAAKRENNLADGLSSSVSGSDSEHADDGNEYDAAAELLTHSAHARLHVRISSSEAAVCWRCAVLPDLPHEEIDDESANEAFNNARTARSFRWAVLLGRGGHFAGAVYDVTGCLGDASVGEACVHKALHRYVVRAQAGGRQSSKDANKSIQSAGSSLRRHNEAALERDMKDTISSWYGFLYHTDVIFIQLADPDKKALFKDSDSPLSLSDKRVRRIPFPTRRPTYKETKRTVQKLLEVSFEQVEHVDTSRATEQVASAYFEGRSGKIHGNDAAPSTSQVHETIASPSKSKKARERERKRRNKELKKATTDEEHSVESSTDASAEKEKEAAAQIREEEQRKADKLRARTGRSGQHSKVPCFLSQA